LIEIIKETPSPLRGEGWGGGETPRFIELILNELILGILGSLVHFRHFHIK